MVVQMKVHWAILVTTTLFSLFLFSNLIPEVHALVVGGKVNGGTSFENGGIFVHEIKPIAVVGNDSHGDHNLHAFDERQQIILSNPLTLDILSSTNSYGVLPKGTMISSHYIFYDPIIKNSIQGCVQFDSEVQGLILSERNLASSDFLQLSDTEYRNHASRGTEPNDSLAINKPTEVCMELYAVTPGDYFRVITGSLPVTVIDSNKIETTVTSNSEIPNWIRNNAGWWANGQIGDSEFVLGIQYLINQKIMYIPPANTSPNSGNSEIPSWIKNNAGWWADEQISDNDFVLGIQYMIVNGLIKINF